MQPLIIDPSKDSPAIRFDPESRVLEIKGESYPDNAAAFYEPVFQWIEEYLGLVGSEAVTVRLQLTYINSSSSKIILNLLDLLEEAVGRGQNVTVLWLYNEDNLTLLECGEEFAEDLETLPFRLTTLESEAAS